MPNDRWIDAATGNRMERRDDGSIWTMSDMDIASCWTIRGVPMFLWRKWRRVQ